MMMAPALMMNRRRRRRRKSKSECRDRERSKFWSRPEAPFIGLLFVVFVVPTLVRAIVRTAVRGKLWYASTNLSNDGPTTSHTDTPKGEQSTLKFNSIIPSVVAFPTAYSPARSYLATGKTGQKPLSSSRLSDDETANPFLQSEHQVAREKIILWRGDKKAGYSMNFRHAELSNAIASVSSDGKVPHLNITDALIYNGKRDLSESQTALFEGAMQYVKTKDGYKSLPSNLFVQAAERCALVREAYEVIAEAETYEELGQIVLANGALSDMMRGGKNEKATWCVRLRKLGDATEESKERKFGKSIRSSLSSEKHALSSMAPLLLKFGGRVQLKDPDCKLVIIEGLNERMKILARVIAKGPKTSVFAPSTRICITNTPLCPIASFSMCNIAQIRDDQKVLDPYAGSCATLLAAQQLAPSCTTVGIEISEKIYIEDIWKDFTTRSLKLPAAIINGDCTDAAVRDKARAAVGGSAFDVIITDPPYGVRERTGSSDKDDDTPLFQFVAAMIDDKNRGNPLLKKGGRLVTFVPHTPGENIMDVLPGTELLERAGLELIDAREQPLNDGLCRWLVTFECKS